MQILAPTPGSTVLDMCAAPGMKTMQLSAALNNQGTVFAIERDLSRFNILEGMLKDHGCRNVTTINEDALKSTHKQCPNVEYILVDPSCSGSGKT